MRRSISCRASTAADAALSGAIKFCTARVRSPITSAEKRARFTTSRGFASRHTSSTWERQGSAHRVQVSACSL